ncbi:phospholipase/carboxylesterase [Kocuria dechangensis]|uniref:Phospholipase/carboxylesterase n=1 Tax=Kocuria dechangensis TaxID=1176249 RepID=A0A917GYP3_9MICC|nr:phospholipase [Kocuria dechangensis]GGG61519.1 phospholipase/carboxylesterase [Kocuria dechangensis]
MSSNMHLTHQPTRHGAPPESAALVVYAVHGRGQSPAFMVEVADRVDLPGVAWVLPQAHDFSWYPQGFLAPTQENQPHLDHALEAIRAHTRPLLGEDGPPVVVLGFSQGACLLSEWLLRDQPHLAGAVLHTGGYLGPTERDWVASPGRGLSGQVVEMFTAEEDAWVPLHRVEATSSAFRSLGAAVELTVYDDPDHHLNDDSVHMIRRYLRHRLGPSAQ